MFVRISITTNKMKNRKYHYYKNIKYQYHSVSSGGFSLGTCRGQGGGLSVSFN
jgi:hypothetical protein